MSDESIARFENKYPDDAEWSAHIRILNDYPEDMILRCIVQYARSGAFYPADMHVDLIRQYYAKQGILTQPAPEQQS